MIVVYAIAKFLAYSAWCLLGLRVSQSGRTSPVSVFQLGAVRWLLGLVFGVAVFFAVGSIDADSAARLYFLIYSPIRLVEWGIMALVIARRSQLQLSRGVTLRLAWWCVGGILVSFLTDVLSPEGMQGRFCVGRCLC